MTEEFLTDFLPLNTDEYSAAKVACVPAEISRSLFVSLTGLTGYPWMFRRSLLTSGKLAFLEGDNNAGMFSIAALNTANLVTIVRGGSPDWEEADNLVTDQLNRDDARGKLIPFVKERITMVAAQIPELPDSASGYAALIAEFETVREMVFSKTGDRDAFDVAAAMFHEHFAEADLSALPIEQFEKYEKLHRIFATDYTTALQHEVAFLKSEACKTDMANIGAAAKLEKVQKQLKMVKESTSFRVGKTLVGTANKAIPTSVRKSLKARLS